ncbi:MAG: GMC oxidoreductase [Myxococcales bacterium]
MNRRDFGRQAFRVAASLGMTSFSLGRVASFGLLGACGGSPAAGHARDDHDLSEDDAGAGDAATGGGQPGTTDAGHDAATLNDSGVRVDRNGVSVLIIGSGYGSAVTALRLTEAGIPVTMLEAGRLWNTPGDDGKIFCKPFTPDGRAMWFQSKTEAQVKTFLGVSTEMETPVEAGVLEARGPREMRVYQGRGVGGGSLVNMALYLAPDRSMFERTLPAVDADAFYGTYLPRAKMMLHAGSASQRMIDSEFYRYSRVGIELARNAGFKWAQLQSGYDFDYMERELDNQVPRSALGGEAGFGNNYGKRSLDKTYLAEALGTGLLTLHALHIVKRIKPNGAGGYVVEVENIDLKGSVLGRKEFSCTHLFVGAGSMATSELLVAARERGDLPNLNEKVGTKWGPNGDLFVALDTPLSLPTGADQCTIPSHCLITRDGKGRRTVAEFAPFPVGVPSWQSFIILIADNPEAGYFKYDAGSDSVNLQWTRSQNEPSVAAAKYIFDQVNAANGTAYSTQLTFQDNGQFGDQCTYHPLGGVPLGEATDEYGRIREYPGLYVTDGSLIPIGLGANPSLSITALAERNIEHVIAADFAS